MESEKQKVVDYFKGMCVAELIINRSNLLKGNTSLDFRVHSIRIPNATYPAVLSKDYISLLQSDLDDSFALFVDSADVAIARLPRQPNKRIVISLKKIRAVLDCIYVGLCLLCT
eukprot:351626_1